MIRNKIIALLSIVLLLSSCFTKKNPSSDGFHCDLKEISTDSTYGYTSENPIKVGGINNGPLHERAYLNSLADSNWKAITYFRSGSCCPTPSENGFLGHAMLDKYIISFKGSNKKVTLYINMYDQEALKAPVGFTILK